MDLKIDIPDWIHSLHVWHRYLHCRWFFRCQCIFHTSTLESSKSTWTLFGTTEVKDRPEIGSSSQTNFHFQGLFHLHSWTSYGSGGLRMAVLSLGIARTLEIIEASLRWLTEPFARDRERFAALQCHCRSVSEATNWPQGMGVHLLMLPSGSGACCCCCCCCCCCYACYYCETHSSFVCQCRIASQNSMSLHLPVLGDCLKLKSTVEAGFDGRTVAMGNGRTLGISPASESRSLIEQSGGVMEQSMGDQLLEQSRPWSRLSSYWSPLPLYV